MSVKKKIKYLIQNIVVIFKGKKIVPILVTKEESKVLEGKVALITGGSGGIGFAIAKKYNECGCKVILAGTNKEKLENNCSKLEEAKYLILDYKKSENFEEKITEAVNIFGKIDILVSSSGVHTDYSGFDWSKVTEDDYDYVMDVNLKGTYFLIQKFAKYLIQNSSKGHILVISSSRGLEPSWSPYRLSKLGTDGIVKGFAQQLLPYGIIVNAIGPGSTATAMQESTVKESIYTLDSLIERMALPEEIAELAKLMVIGAGDLIVGQTVYLSSGRGIIDMR